jgi:chemotaxis protein MotB
MNMTRIPVALASMLFPLLVGCASQKTLMQYQDEVRALREERTQLKKENKELRAQNEAFEASLAEASVKPNAPAAQPADNPELDALGIDTFNRGGNLVISIPSEITFPSGKAELTKKGQEALQAVARALAQHKDGIYWIEGHTDSDPIVKSKWDSNRDLSVERAMAVLHYLVEDCNVPDEQCVVAGHGQYQPIAANDDKSGKARNRRVEIVVHRSKA